ncbi:MAG TPA: hypothetical protein VGF45_20975, partial [Polyangia bacterium]
MPKFVTTKAGALAIAGKYVTGSGVAQGPKTGAVPPAGSRHAVGTPADPLARDSTEPTATLKVRTATPTSRRT